jgi:hypothetical protein
MKQLDKESGENHDTSKKRLNMIIRYYDFAWKQ